MIEPNNKEQLSADDTPDIGEVLNYDPQKEDSDNSKLLRNCIAVAGGVVAVGLIIVGLMQFSPDQNTRNEEFSEQDIADIAAGKQNSVSGRIISIDSGPRSFVLDTTAFTDGGEYIVHTNGRTRFEVQVPSPLPKMNEEERALYEQGLLGDEDLGIVGRLISKEASFEDFAVGDNVAVGLVELIRLNEVESLDAVSVIKVE